MHGIVSLAQSTQRRSHNAERDAIDFAACTVRVGKYGDRRRGPMAARVVQVRDRDGNSDWGFGERFEDIIVRIQPARATFFGSTSENYPGVRNG
jgi:hypothetical protein